MKIKRIFSGILAAGMLAGYALFPNGAELFAVKASALEGDVAINAANFPDEKFRNYIIENFDTDNNGSLSEEEIAAVSNICVDQEKLTSLKGIEFFTVLTELDCGINQLTELDLSKNTALTTLDCSNNQLTKLDISKNTELTTLFCDHTQLTKLDVSNNTKLTRLNCQYNYQLTELDVSKNTKLMYLFCTESNLTSLNLGKNTEFNSLYCGGNKLTGLDVSGVEAIEYIYCSSNNITELDLSKNTELSTLYCDNNQLTELDISKNTKLDILYCYNNQLTELDVSRNRRLIALSTDKEITMYGLKGSDAEDYAKRNGITFIEVELPTAPVTGTITVSGKDETAEGVSVTVTDANGKPCSVDIDLESGALSISGLSDGTYTLTITKSKYCPRDCTVTIADGQMTGELSVKLQKYGDIDNTGEINISDALQIVNFRNSKTSSFDKASGDDLKYLEKLADVNGDGTVNINDALQIVNYRNGKKSAFDDIA